MDVSLLSSSNLFLATCLPVSLVLATVVMESKCSKEINSLLKKKAGRELYRKAIWANVLNMLIISPFACFFVLTHLGAKHPGPYTLCEQIGKISGIIAIEGFLLHLIHVVMHQVKGFYWMYV